MGCDFIGYASHRNNLAIRDILEVEKGKNKSVQKLMVELPNVLPSAKLRQITGLRQLVNNVTRWSSTYIMLKRYLQLRILIPQLQLMDVSILLSSLATKDTLEKRLMLSKKLESVRKIFQDDKITLCNVQALFDAVIDQNPSSESRLVIEASIVMQPDFECLKVNVQENRISELSIYEKVSIEAFATAICDTR